MTSYSNYDCVSCLQAAGGQQCLMDGQLSQGTCCKQDVPLEELTTFCQTQSDNQFCSSTARISNGILGEFTCPASSNWCPSDASSYLTIDEMNKEYTRSHRWGTQVPTLKALTWNCKYVIRAKRELVSQEEESERGYIMLQVEQYGFDEEVFLIVQPHGQYADFSQSNKDQVTQIYKVAFSQRFFIPAEHDLLLAFKPVKSESNHYSPSGLIKLRAWLQRSLSEADVA